jgi:hypothetical protein
MSRKGKNPSTGVKLPKLKQVSHKMKRGTQTKHRI